MHELIPEKFGSVRSLFQGFDYSLSIQAAIEGNNPGRIFVDDINQPRTSLALTVEGYLLAGENHNPEVIGALRRLLKEKIFSGQVYINGDWSLSLAVHPDSWEARLPELIPTHEVEKLERYHYLCDALKFDWRKNLPEGYTVRQVDQAILQEEGFHFSDPLGDWMEIKEVWGSDEKFLETDASHAILHGTDVAAWCTPDCFAGNRIDVGVMTAPGHRRKGLATVVVAATVEHCLESGFSAVGWHCSAENIASWKTAEKIGFERAHKYAYYYYMYDPIDHLAELGWYYYRQEEYIKTVGYYERVFAQREQNPDYYYHLAASAYAILGDSEKAIYYLFAAAQHGWQHAEYTKGQEEFSFLRGMPEWENILARMGEHSGEEKI